MFCSAFSPFYWLLFCLSLKCYFFHQILVLAFFLLLYFFSREVHLIIIFNVHILHPVLSWKPHPYFQLPAWLKRLSMLACIGEGNGNPLQCSCLENPGDGPAWWAAVYGVTRIGHDWSDLAESAAWWFSSSMSHRYLKHNMSKAVCVIRSVCEVLISQWLRACCCELCLVAQSCPILCDPTDCNLPGFSVHEIFQARTLEWGAISFSKSSLSLVQFG